MYLYLDAGEQLFLARRSNVSAIYSHDRVSHFALAISHEDYLRISTLQEELRF